MPKYHVNPETGEPGRCTAKVGNCLYGDSAPHFETKEAAHQHFEATQVGSFASAEKKSSLPAYAKAVLRNPPEFEEEDYAYPEDNWGDPIEVEYGVYDDQARELLMKGQCLGFALELAKAFGTNRVAVHHQTLEDDELAWDEETDEPLLDENGETYNRTYESPYHVYAIAPDGSYWDGLGRAPKALIEPIENGQLDEYDSDDAEALYSGYMGEQSRGWAKSLIPKMLQEEAAKKTGDFLSPLPQRFYHVTLKENKSKLFVSGLEPRLGHNSSELGETEPRVYLFPSKEAAEEALGGWLGEQYDDDDELVLMSVPARVVKEPSPTFDDPGGSWEWSTKNTVPGRFLEYEAEI